MNNQEIQTIKNLHLLAFGDDEGKEVSNLAESFLHNPQTICINAIRDGKIVGNVLFTPFVFEDDPTAKCYLLAPLGVLPAYQNKGVGTQLIKQGIKQLKELNTDAIFVLGIPTYYPLHGFKPTNKQTPYPELLTAPEAWMSLDLTQKATTLSGKTIAIKEFMNPQMWDTSLHG